MLACLQFFLNVWQDVLQTKLSKLTILPEGASDGFANNFDQLKWGGAVGGNISFIWLFKKTVKSKQDH